MASQCQCRCHCSVVESKCECQCLMKDPRSHLDRWFTNSINSHYKVVFFTTVVYTKIRLLIFCRLNVKNNPRLFAHFANWVQSYSYYNNPLGAHDWFVSALHEMPAQTSDEKDVCPSVRLSVCPSVRLSNAWIMTKRKKNLSRFLYHTKEHLA